MSGTRSGARPSPTEPPQYETLILPPLYPFQRALVTDRARDVLCVSATQIGKTTAVASWLLAMAWEYTGTMQWMWYAPSYRQCVPGQRMLYELATSAEIMRDGPKPPFRTNPPPPMLLTNDVSIGFRTWDDPQQLMGDPIPGGVVDEAGLMTTAAQSAISTRRSHTLGPLRYIGNPGVKSGPFRRLCKLALSPENDGTYAYHRWTWRDKQAALLLESPERAAAYERFINEERGSIPEFEFRRLYEAEWTEDEAAVFRKLHECVDPGLPVWGEPEEGRTYSMGIDVAQVADWLVSLVIDNQTYEVVDVYRVRGVGYPDAAVQIQHQQRKWNNAQACVETNGPGIALIQEFDRIGVPYVPFTTTNQSKQEIILNLAADFQNKRPRLPEEPTLIGELEGMRYTRTASGLYRYAAPEGEHDDQVMALAIAAHLRRMGGAGVLEWLT